jgi:arylsulfatase A-like enzyme
VGQLSAEEKKLFIRQVEVFAAYAAYSDHEIGRVIQAFQDLGKLDNTLIIYINGDNGTSAEGGPLARRTRSHSSTASVAGGRADEVLRRLGHRADLQPHVGRLVLGLRHALRLVQAERLAARRHQPEHGRVVAGAHQGQGRLREQFVHVIDVVPTILEAAGIKAPEMVDGIKQAPIEGTSFPTPSMRRMPRCRRATRPSTSR